MDQEEGLGVGLERGRRLAGSQGQAARRGHQTQAAGRLPPCHHMLAPLIGLRGCLRAPCGGSGLHLPARPPGGCWAAGWAGSGVQGLWLRGWACRAGSGGRSAVARGWSTCFVCSKHVERTGKRRGRRWQAETGQPARRASSCGVRGGRGAMQDRDPDSSLTRGR